MSVLMVTYFGKVAFNFQEVVQDVKVNVNAKGTACVDGVSARIRRADKDGTRAKQRLKKMKFGSNKVDTM